ncbi:hypothetical protein ACFVUN_03660 [Kitasatospora griseola]|uniref:hypothetical protein n=1 Tax=Kitasatospora griseola TaxID=2064 RepID=UPI0036DB3F81
MSGPGAQERAGCDEYALHRVAHERVLAFGGLPDALRAGSRPHPTLPITTCFELAGLERHLTGLVEGR